MRVLTIMVKVPREKGNKNVSTKAGLVTGEVPSPAFVIRLIPSALAITPAINIVYRFIISGFFTAITPKNYLY